MCTLVIAWQAFPGAPVVAAANRDERFDRPSSPPSLIEAEPAIVAPRDERAGGTWLGHNEHGLFAAITNRWTDRELPSGRSRGLLVRDALRQPTAAEAVRAVSRAVEEDDCAGFILVVADASDAVLVEWDGRLAVRDLDPGVHVVMNVGVDDTFDVPAERAEPGRRQIEAARRLRTDLSPEPGEEPEAWLDRAAAALRDHGYGVCVHGDGFGTRSSSLVVIGADGTTSHRYADGPPCKVEYAEVGIPDRFLNT